MVDNTEPVAGQSNIPKRDGPGRPLKFQSLIELQTKIEAYFFDCDPHPVEVIEYKWHEIEETYEETVRGKKVEKTRLVEDHSRMPETVKTLKLSAPENYSITGLALALDTNRLTLLNYEDGKYLKSPDDENYDADEAELMHQFINTIKKAKAKIEHDVQRRLDTNAVAGTIFNLKNNFAWIDRQETDGVQEVIVTTRKHSKDPK